MSEESPEIQDSLDRTHIIAFVEHWLAEHFDWPEVDATISSVEQIIHAYVITETEDWWAPEDESRGVVLEYKNLYKPLVLFRLLETLLIIGELFNATALRLWGGSDRVLVWTKESLDGYRSVYEFVLYMTAREVLRCVEIDLEDSW